MRYPKSSLFLMYFCIKGEIKCYRNSSWTSKCTNVCLDFWRILLFIFFHHFFLYLFVYNIILNSNCPEKQLRLFRLQLLFYFPPFCHNTFDSIKLICFSTIKLICRICGRHLKPNVFPWNTNESILTTRNIRVSNQHPGISSFPKTYTQGEFV